MKEIIEELETYLTYVDDVVNKIRANKSAFISQKNLKDKISNLSSRWFEEFSTKIRKESVISDEEINKVDSVMEKMIQMSTANNRKSSYIALLSPLRKNIQRDILIPMIRTGRSSPMVWEGISQKILVKITSNDERQYYEEAFRAAKNQCYKAATVMAGCAVVDRLRDFVIKKGFASFNSTSKKLKASQSGFYKKFNKEFNIKIENELQEVFEKDLTIIISGMISLDLNQLQAILHLFDIRNSCAHPSSYIMDELSFAHFLSEIYNLILNNQKFV